MIELTPKADRFSAQIRELLKSKPLGFRSIRVEKHHHIYTSGQQDPMVYLIEWGQIKLVLPTPEGKECLLAIRADGEIFGELCLSGLSIRLETAVAMNDSTILQVPHRSFIACLKNQGMLEGLVQYLAVRISEQEEVIATLATVNSEQRLGKTLLSLARRMGRSDCGRILINHRISQQELSEMIGTTRPRVTIFLKKFRALGLIQFNQKHFMIIAEKKLQEYIWRHECGEAPDMDMTEALRDSGIKPPPLRPQNPIP